MSTMIEYLRHKDGEFGERMSELKTKMRKFDSLKDEICDELHSLHRELESSGGLSERSWRIEEENRMRERDSDGYYRGMPHERRYGRDY